MNDNLARAAIFVRQAVENDERLEQERHLCEQFAGESHWHVARVFEECASGMELFDDRPALLWMIYDAELNVFDKLIVLCAEHLSRDGDSFVAITNRLRRAGVEIVFLE